MFLELDLILNDYENKKQIFLYSGRGPSSDMHIGHMPSFLFTKWLQDVFQAIVIIQIADDEKYMFKNMDFDSIYKLGFENAKDIINYDCCKLSIRDKPLLSTPSYFYSSRSCLHPVEVD